MLKPPEPRTRLVRRYVSLKSQRRQPTRPICLRNISNCSSFNWEQRNQTSSISVSIPLAVPTSIILHRGAKQKTHFRMSSWSAVSVLNNVPFAKLSSMWLYMRSANCKEIRLGSFASTVRSSCPWISTSNASRRGCHASFAVMACFSICRSPSKRGPRPKKASQDLPFQCLG